jgi:pimeloyl-ACP methyl ester carboxylesterase
MNMRKVTSKDGTTIAFDQSGEGAAIILVGGAIQHRAIDPGTAQLAALLAQHFTVFHYDRRGRGDSGDTQPYAVEREIEDLEALINEAGGSAFVYGMSSGVALALEAAIKLGDKIKKLAMYEAPYNSDDTARQSLNRDLESLEFDSDFLTQGNVPHRSTLPWRSTRRVNGVGGVSGMRSSETPNSSSSRAPSS